MSELAAGVTETIRKFRRGGVEHQTCGFDGRSAEEYDAAFELHGFFALCINHTQTGGAALCGIKDYAVNNAVRPNRELARLGRRRKRGIQATEIRLRDATAVADS